MTNRPYRFTLALDRFTLAREAGLDGMEAVRQTRAVFDTYGSGCQVLVASIRHTAHAVDSLPAGADIITLLIPMPGPRLPAKAGDL